MKARKATKRAKPGGELVHLHAEGSCTSPGISPRDTVSRGEGLGLRVIEAFQALDLLRWALSARLEGGNEYETFEKPINDAEEMLRLFYDRFLDGSREEYEAIARGEARVRAEPRTVATAAE